jgi:hypothetical protein
MNAVLDPYAEERDAQPIEKRYGDKLVDVGTLTSVVKKLRDFVENKAIPFALQSLVNENKSLRRELLELKYAALSAPDAGTAPQSAMMSVGMQHLEKRMDASTADMKILQERHQAAQMQLQREVKHLKDRNKQLGGFFDTWAQEVKGMYSRIETLEGFCASIPTMLKDLFGSLPAPIVEVPHKALAVHVAPASITLAHPPRHTVKSFEYDPETKLPTRIHEREVDGDSLEEMITPD